MAGFRETPNSPITIAEKEELDRGQIPPDLGEKLYRGTLDEDRALSFPDGASASDPLALASDVPTQQLTQDQVDSFPSGASSSDQLVVESSVIGNPSATSLSPLGSWTLNGDLLDSSGNGYDMVSVGGGAAYTPSIIRGELALVGGVDSVKSTNSDLQTISTISGVFLMNSGQRSGGLSYCIRCAGTASELEVENSLYSVFLNNTGTLSYFYEKDAGVNVSYETTNRLAECENYVVGWTFSSNVVQFYVNGEPFDSPSGTLDAPTGGGNAILVIGGTETGQGMQGSISRVKIWHSALTQAQQKEEAMAIVPLLVSS